jgi:hypothetical protein
VRGQVRIRAEITGVPPFLQVKPGDKVAGMGVVPVDAVAVDGDVREAVIGRDEKLVDLRREAVECQLGRIGHRVEEQNTIPHLVDRDETTAAGHEVGRCHRALLLDVNVDDRRQEPGCLPTTVSRFGSLSGALPGPGSGRHAQR